MRRAASQRYHTRSIVSARRLQDAQRVLSIDGAIPAGAPEQVLKYVALSSAKVRDSTIDLSRLYTNEYVKND